MQNYLQNTAYLGGLSSTYRQFNWMNILVCVAAAIVTSAHGQLTIHDDHFYVLNNNDVIKWEAAAAACRDDGGYLVSINTQQEQVFAFEFYKSSTTADRAWIGLKCPTPSSCTWEDGMAVSYTAWWRDREYAFL